MLLLTPAAFMPSFKMRLLGSRPCWAVIVLAAFYADPSWGCALNRVVSPISYHVQSQAFGKPEELPALASFLIENQFVYQQTESQSAAKH